MEHALKHLTIAEQAPAGSALPLEVDIARLVRSVRFVPNGDIARLEMKEAAN
jgi:hypothetical protein